MGRLTVAIPHEARSVSCSKKAKYQQNPEYSISLGKITNISEGDLDSLLRQCSSGGGWSHYKNQLIHPAVSLGD